MINPGKRRELLDRLEKAEKQDGLITQRSQNELLIEICRELLLDSVYTPVYRSAVEPQAEQKVGPKVEDNGADG